MRQMSIAIGEKVSLDDINAASVQPPPTRNGSYKSGRGTVALSLVMRATQETTDFVTSVLIWALKRDPSSHPASTMWQQNLEVFRGDEALWSPSFRRLQERLRKVLFEILREERSGTRRNNRQIAFEELKLAELCVTDLRLEIEELAARERDGEEPSTQVLESLAQQLMQLLDKLQVNSRSVPKLVNHNNFMKAENNPFSLDSILPAQVRLEKVSTQVNQLFDELVQARKKLLDAAQRPGTIHRAQTF